MVMEHVRKPESKKFQLLREAAAAADTVSGWCYGDDDSETETREADYRGTRFPESSWRPEGQRKICSV